MHICFCETINTDVSNYQFAHTWQRPWEKFSNYTAGSEIFYLLLEPFVCKGALLKSYIVAYNLFYFSSSLIAKLWGNERGIEEWSVLKIIKMGHAGWNFVGQHNCSDVKHHRLNGDFETCCWEHYYYYVFLILRLPRFRNGISFILCWRSFALYLRWPINSATK